MAINVCVVIKKLMGYIEIYVYVIVLHEITQPTMCHKDTCVICLEDAKFRRLNPRSRALAVQRVRNKANLPKLGERLKCGHVFHRKCIVSWFMNIDSEGSYSCPMCRADIRFSNNMGLMNIFMFPKKFHLEDKKAYENGGYPDGEYAYDDDSDDDSDLSDDQETDFDSEYGEGESDYECEDDESEWEDYTMLGCQESLSPILGNVRTMDVNMSIASTNVLSDDDDDDSLGDDDQDPHESNDQQYRQQYQIGRFCWRRWSRVCIREIQKIHQPKSPIYSFRPHQSCVY